MKNKFLGLHLSGANSERSALVAMEKNIDNQYVISEIHEKIGSFGSVFSDDRLVHLIQHISPNETIFVDAPLSAPPCVVCTREVCPGAVKCDDLSVAYLLSITETHREQKKPKKKRPLNPQAHRVWDALNMLGECGGLEPTYTSNKAPLAIRAKTLQKRLKHISNCSYSLKETAILNSLIKLAGLFNEIESDVRMYRSFENGYEVRLDFLRQLDSLSWISLTETNIQTFATKLPVFNAFICSLVAMLDYNKLTILPPKNFELENQWVYIPEIQSNIGTCLK